MTSFSSSAISIDKLMILSMDISEDENEVIYEHGAVQLYLWDLNTNETRFIKKYESTLDNRTQRIAYLHYLDSDNVAIVLNDGNVHTLNLDTGEETEKFVSPFEDHNEFIVRAFAERTGLPYPVKFSPNEKYLVIENSIWDWEEERLLGRFALDMEPVIEVDISPDGEWLAVSFQDGVMGIWEMEEIIGGDSEIQEFSNY
jgi:WD40 repeat protein